MALIRFAATGGATRTLPHADAVTNGAHLNGRRKQPGASAGCANTARSLSNDARLERVPGREVKAQQGIQRAQKQFTLDIQQCTRPFGK